MRNFWGTVGNRLGKSLSDFTISNCSWVIRHSEYPEYPEPAAWDRMVCRGVVSEAAGGKLKSRAARLRLRLYHRLLHQIESTLLRVLRSDSKHCWKITFHSFTKFTKLQFYISRVHVLFIKIIKKVSIVVGDRVKGKDRQLYWIQLKKLQINGVNK